MRYRGLVPGLTGVVRADTRFTGRVNICCQLHLPRLNFCWDSLFRCKTISLPVLGYGSYFCPNIRKGNIFKIVSIYQPMHISISTYQLVYIQCRQRRLFHGWNASSTIGELEVVGYIQVWAATVSRWETNKPQNLNKYNENLDIDIKEFGQIY